MGIFGNWDPVKDSNTVSAALETPAEQADKFARGIYQPITEGGGDWLSGISNGINRELSNAGNSINSGLNQATGGASFEDVAFNFLTGGILGYEDGRIKAGALTRGFTEGVGELTGANAARAANNRAEALLAEQRAEAARLREEELARLRRNDVSASRSAGRSQRAAFYGAGSGLGADSGAFNNLTRDFLGL